MKLDAAEFERGKADYQRWLEKERAEGLKEKEQQLRQEREELSKRVSAQIDQIRKQEQAVKGELEAQAATIGSLISSQILRR